jgi:hypothetical protein
MVPAFKKVPVEQILLEGKQFFLFSKKLFLRYSEPQK